VSLGPAMLRLAVADAGVVAEAWLAAVGALLGRGMVLFGTSPVNVRHQ